MRKYEVEKIIETFSDIDSHDDPIVDISHKESVEKDYGCKIMLNTESDISTILNNIQMVVHKDVVEYRFIINGMVVY